MTNQKKKFEHMVLLQYSSYLKENTKMFERNALKKKFCASSIVGKTKLIIKLVLSAVGIQSGMQLETFRREEDIRQALQDLSVYMSLIEGQKYDTVAVAKENQIVEQDMLNTEAILEKEPDKTIKAEIEEKKSYLALMAESLNVGGLEEVIKLLALEYKKRNIPIKIFCTQCGGKIAEELQRNGIEVIIFNGKKSVFEKYIKKNMPVLINSHYVVDFMDIIAKYQIPVVEVIHNMYVFLPERRLKKEQQKTKAVTEYIAVSKTAADIFVNKVTKIEPGKMHVIGNTGRKFESAIMCREKVREVYNIPQNAFVFLVAGTIDARKNQVGIIRAWNILTRLTNKNLALVLAGTCSGSDYEEKLRRYIAQWELDDSVYIIGYCDKISDLMGASDVLIINSYYEGWSMAATEALYSGLPLIHSNCGSGVELVASGKNGILISNPLSDIYNYTTEELEESMRAGKCDNIYELVVAMLTLLQDGECVYKKENIRKYAQEKFTVDEMINAYLEVYCKACRK